MSLQQLRNDLAGIRAALKPTETANRIIIYDPVQGIPGNLSSGDGVYVFIPDNGRDSMEL